MLFCHGVITVCAGTFVTCTLIKINHQSTCVKTKVLYTYYIIRSMRNHAGTPASKLLQIIGCVDELKKRLTEACSGIRESIDQKLKLSD